MLFVRIKTLLSGKDRTLCLTHIIPSINVFSGMSLVAQLLGLCFQYRGGGFDPWLGN